MPSLGLEDLPQTYRHLYHMKTQGRERKKKREGEGKKEIQGRVWNQKPWPAGEEEVSTNSVFSKQMVL